MRFLIPLTLALAAVAATPIKADDDHDSALRLRERREILPLDELMQRLGLGKDVRILEIESEMEHGRAQYEIEYVDRAGRIRKVRVDARTGDTLGDKD
jgi:uncharacterized membrane protein YkoI